MPYVIKNCGCNPACDECYTRCKDITNCVMKRIVATCKQEISISSKDAPTNAYAMGRVVVAEKILEQLEIEETDD